MGWRRALTGTEAVRGAVGGGGGSRTRVRKGSAKGFYTLSRFVTSRLSSAEAASVGFEASLEAKGFVVLNWADAGWTHFFTQKPVAVPDDLRTLKLFTWAGDPEGVEVWKAAGFNPIPLPATEIQNALQTGLVNALATPPQVAVISQYYTSAKNMTNMPWQLLLGATVINKSTWDRIPADIRPALQEAARDAGRRLQEEIRKGGEKDVAEMKKRGLNVVQVTPPQRALWQQLTEKMYPRIRGPIVPADAFDEALRYRDDYRKRMAASGGR